jgi:hypothetical protein
MGDKPRPSSKIENFKVWGIKERRSGYNSLHNNFVVNGAMLGVIGRNEADGGAD